MKKIIIASVLTLMCASSVAFASSLPGTGVNASKHDMTALLAAGAPDTMKRVCVYCHTPHNAEVNGGPSLDVYPLWNKTLVATAGFTAYEWAAYPNFAAVGVITDPLAGPSRLCMSCHDGTIGLDQHSGNGSGSLGTPALRLGQPGMGAASAVFGTDLKNDHPIGFDYTIVAAARPGELVPVATKFAASVTASVAANTYQTVNPRLTGKTILDVLYNGTIMTCATCHDVHNKDNVAMSLDATKNFFLYADEKESLICLSCHKK